jgi:hypothetical protein
MLKDDRLAVTYIDEVDTVFHTIKKPSSERKVSLQPIRQRFGITKLIRPHHLCHAQASLTQSMIETPNAANNQCKWSAAKFPSK